MSHPESRVRTHPSPTYPLMLGTPKLYECMYVCISSSRTAETCAHTAGAARLPSGGQRRETLRECPCLVHAGDTRCGETGHELSRDHAQCSMLNGGSMG